MCISDIYDTHEILKMKKTFQRRFAVILHVFVGVFSYKNYPHSAAQQKKLTIKAVFLDISL